VIITTNWEELNSVLCFRCGHNNPDTIPGFCDKCNARLTEDQQSNTPKESSKTVRLEKFINMGNKFVNNEITIDEFQEFLQKQKKSFEQSENNLKSMIIPEELMNEFKPQIEMGLKGINLYKIAIETMEKALMSETLSDEEIKNSILKALEVTQEGNEKINDCYKMSEEKLREIREETPLYQSGSEI
jgi:hypothetical protein